MENPFPNRVAGDIDLVQEITSLMIKAGHLNPFAWHEQMAMANVQEQGPKLQRFLINRYWRVKMGLCAEDSTMPRFCLVESGDDKEYLKIFESNILPFIIRNNLGS
jgi:hypothetical protein